MGALIIMYFATFNSERNYLLLATCLISGTEWEQRTDGSWKETTRVCSVVRGATPHPKHLKSIALVYGIPPCTVTHAPVAKTTR